MELREYVFPLCGLGHRLAGQGVLHGVYGTSFSLGDDRFITAAHVLKDCQAHDVAGIGFLDGANWQAAPIDEHEVFEDYDVAILTAGVPIAKPLVWNLSHLCGLADVWTTGYPHAYNIELRQIGEKAFKGHVVSLRQTIRYPARPLCYELSFVCQRGLSGAPLLPMRAGPTVGGIILGNEETNTIVYGSGENDGERPLEKWHMQAWGLAVQAGTIAHLESRILGGTLADYLKKSNLYAGEP